MAIPNTFADKTGEVLLGNLDYNFEVLDVRISNNQTQIENLDLRIDAIEGVDVDFTGYATETYVNNAVSSLVNSAPSTLDTLNELAAALGDDANFSTTITNSIADKAPISNPTFTGNITVNGDILVDEIRARSNQDLTITCGESFGSLTDGSFNDEFIRLAGEQGVKVYASSDNLTSGLNRETTLIDTSGNMSLAGSITPSGAATIRDVTGNYGSLEIDGAATGGWEGYSIGGWSVFMSQGTASGIYNDVNNQWIIYGTHNAATDIRYAGSAKLTTTSGGVAVTGALTATGDITAYFSDERLKTKLGNIENAIDKVNQLNGFYYEANDKAVELGYIKKKEVGLSAQEIEKVLPEIVAPAPIDPEYKTIHYERVVPLLVEAIKELTARVKELENK